MDNELSNREEENSNKSTPLTYLRGMLGATLGALVAGIPWGLLIYLGWFVSWLAFIIGFGAFFGYKLFKGPKITMFATATIWVVSLASAFVWYLGMITYQVVTEIFNIPFQAIHLIDFPHTIFTTPAYREILFGDLWVPTIIIILGLIGIRSVIRGYTDPVSLREEEKAAAKAILENLEASEETTPEPVVETESKENTEEKSE